MEVINPFRPQEFPGATETQTLNGIFLLKALQDYVAEQAEIVTDAVADGGNGERRHALHEAGLKPSQAAIAERRIRLAFTQLREADAEIAQRGLEYRQ